VADVAIAAGEDILRCVGLTKRYGALTVLDEASIRVGRGEIVGVAGPNGAGKTTLFDVATGYVRPDDGVVELAGEDVTRMKAHERARRGIGRTFQSPLVPAKLTIGDALHAGAIAWSPPPGEESISRARELVGFDVDDDRESGTLDTIGRRKLLLVSLLSREPAVLLLDEPCSGLLAAEIDEVDRLLLAIVREFGIGVLVIEHRLELLRSIADRVVVLDEGKEIAEGPPSSVFDDPAVRRAYFDAPSAA
jgi:ABC-type branched-subunit amino acid transport system ATPase component